ncbi:hypothetical protein BCBBV1cgp27 [Bacillus phage BCASJ1c]|uniref:27 n=1 Tax=Bacillus phage BCASJ1c TaxID=294382 RepID=Q5YA83_9CAUD|nr:hypothetical protein BCBBV1cgp27 [Bacillus phage BCASJ1c]AAU85074.1 27 [Bacillus phage BCASJ1c]
MKLKLSDHHIQMIAQEAIKAYRENEKKSEKEKHDKRLHNIKLLLKSYRGLMLHCENLINDLEAINSTSIQDLDIDEINLESIESIKKSRKDSLAMVLFIKTKMDAYKRSCSQDELKYFRVLEKKYLTERKYTTSEIAEIECVEPRTVNRYVEKAMEDLPVIFFGIDAIKFK